MKINKLSLLFILTSTVVITLCIIITLKNLNLIKIGQPTITAQSPMQMIKINIHNAQQKQLFNQLEKFADKNAFAIRIAQTAPTGKNFSIQMWRHDIKIIGANPFEANAFQLGVFTTTVGVPENIHYIDNLIKDFRSHIEQIKNSKFIIEKKK